MRVSTRINQFWICTSGRDNSGASDLTVFSASDIDDNQSFFRIMVRDIGVMQLHAANDGTDVAKFYTNSSNKIAYGSGTLEPMTGITWFCG